MEAQRRPSFACNNDGAQNSTVIPTPYGNISWQSQHELSLAAFMMGMEEGSYFGSGRHWDDPGWHVWWPEYDRPLGRPVDPPMMPAAGSGADELRYTRRFASGTSVGLDLRAHTASIAWGRA